MNTRPPPCAECGGRLKRMVGDDNWICREAIAERAGGGKGPFRHNGLVLQVSYVLRSSKNREDIAQEKLTAERMAREVEATNVSRKEQGLVPLMLRVPDWQKGRPGDLLVDRQFKAAYLIDKDGSHRRLPKDVALEAVEKVRELVAAIKAHMEVPNPMLSGYVPAVQENVEVGSYA